MYRQDWPAWLQGLAWPGLAECAGLAAALFIHLAMLLYSSIRMKEEVSGNAHQENKGQIPGISSPEMKWIKYREKTIERQGLRL